MRIDETLLLDAAEDLPSEPGAGTLVIGGSVALPESLTTTGRRVTWLPLDVREAEHAPDGITVLTDPGMPLPADASFAEVIVPVPPERDLGRRWLVLARHHLREDGRLVIAGANATGIRSTITDAEALFGPALREDFRSKHRVAVLRAGEMPESVPAWAEEPGIAEGSWAAFTFAGPEGPIELATLPGVFAASRLDVGTELLLAHLDITPGGRVLDVGSGAGTIGFTAKARGAGEVVMSDVNLLAVAAARETIRRGDLPAVTVVAGDVYGGVPAGDRFDLIVSNPPFHQGKDVDYEMPQRLIREAKARLVPGGRLILVANAFLPYERLLEERFRVVKELANTRRFKVLLAMRSR